MCTYLAKRGDTCYFRRVIPAQLRPTFDGRSEFMISLRVKDRDQGKRLALARAARPDLDARWEAEGQRPDAYTGLGCVSGQRLLRRSFSCWAGFLAAVAGLTYRPVTELRKLKPLLGDLPRIATSFGYAEQPARLNLNHGPGCLFLLWPDCPAVLR